MAPFIFSTNLLKTKAFYAFLLFFGFMGKMEFKKLLKKTWYFIWEDDSIWSWIVNIILAFVLIKFIVYPGLGFILSTSHPVVAVVSESMEHNMEFDEWWEKNKDWYIENGINKEYFRFLYSWYNFTAKIKSFKRFNNSNKHITILASNVN